MNGFDDLDAGSGEVEEGVGIFRNLSLEKERVGWKGVERSGAE